jgi:hypothetical protein
MTGGRPLFRSGSFSTELDCPHHVRFPPDSDQTADVPDRQLRANKRHRATTCVRSAQPVRWKHIRPSMLRPQLRPCRCDEQRPSNRCPILSLRLTTYFRRLCPDRFRCCSNKYACQRRGAEILRQSCDHPFHSSTDSFLTMLTTFDRAISRCDGERAMSEGSLSRSYDPYVGLRSSPARFS